MYTLCFITDLSSNLSFYTIDLNDKHTLDELIDFLRKNYIESDDEMIRFSYTEDNIKWNYASSKCIPELLLCIRNISTGELVSTIFGKPVQIKLNGIITTQVEKSFLCVAKKFRGIGLSKIIDGELMRRTINLGMKYMFYTSGFSKPATKKMFSLRYYHKTINFEKMSKLWSISNNSSITKKIIDYEKGEICRKIEPRDVPICTAKLNNKLSCFDASYIFDEESFFFIIFYILPKLFIHM
jgi:hypothetical protein